MKKTCGTCRWRWEYRTDPGHFYCAQFAKTGCGDDMPEDCGACSWHRTQDEVIPEEEKVPIVPRAYFQDMSVEERDAIDKGFAMGLSGAFRRNRKARKDKGS